MDQFPDGIDDPALWSIVANEMLSRPSPRDSILNQEVLLSSSICLVQVQCLEAKPTWMQAGWAAMLAAAGGSTAIAGKRTLRLQEPNLLVFPKTADSWILQVAFVRWLPTVRLVVKEFGGREALLKSSVVYSTEPVIFSPVNPLRRELTIRNDSDRSLYLGLGETVTLTDYFVLLPPGAMAGLPETWKGVVMGVWADGGGGEAVIKEFL